MYCILLSGTSLWCSSASVPCCTSRYMAVVFLLTVLWCTSRYIAVVFLFISTVLYFQVHRYGVPVHEYCAVLPGTSLWYFPETDMYFAVILCHMCCRLFQGTSLWCSCLSVLCCTSRYIAMVFLFISTYCVVLPGTSPWCSPQTDRCLAVCPVLLPGISFMVFLFISTVLYFLVHRYGVPVHEYCVVLPGTSLWFSCSVLCCTSRYIAMVSLFMSTVLYFQVHRYGVPVHQYCVVLPGTSL